MADKEVGLWAAHMTLSSLKRASNSLFNRKWVSLGAELLTTLSDRRAFSLNTPAFTDMMNTGNLAIVKNRSLRDGIIQEFSAMKQWKLSIRTNDRIFVDEGFNPFLREHGVTLRLPESDLSAGDSWSKLVNEYFADEMLNPRGARSQLWPAIQ